jgi:hypothetical protein
MASTLPVRTFEFIPIYDPRCLRGKEAPALAGGPCTGVPSCPPVFLALTRVTVDELPRLVLSFEAALPAPGRAATPSIMS